MVENRFVTVKMRRHQKDNDYRNVAGYAWHVTGDGIDDINGEGTVTQDEMLNRALKSYNGQGWSVRQCGKGEPYNPYHWRALSVEMVVEYRLLLEKS